MSKRGWSGRLLLRYVLYQVPGFILLILIIVMARQWFYIPAWVIACIIALWITKDVLLFPYVWRAYEGSIRGNIQPMVGRRGVVEKRLDPSGYVKVNGELWQAELIKGNSPVNRGQEIEVQGIRGLTLLVKPFPVETPYFTDI
ncbi:MAG: NfeD family protein [Nitrospirae bacterium]|jgi:membrane protein implicated in regulation of membrane protease activity|nr:NfeD family protein [Nitrospirota bacterium]